MSKYIKAFRFEFRRLEEAGMKEIEIEAFYPTWHEIFCSNVRYKENTWHLSDSGDDDGRIECSIMIPWEYDGTQKNRKANRKAMTEHTESEGYSPWSSIRPHTYEISSPDITDELFGKYDETQPLLEQIGDLALYRALCDLPDIELDILEMRMHDLKQKEIAEKLGISGAAVCKRMKHIEKKLGPYFREKHFFAS